MSSAPSCPSPTTNAIAELSAIQVSQLYPPNPVLFSDGDQRQYVARLSSRRDLHFRFRCLLSRHDRPHEWRQHVRRSQGSLQVHSERHHLGYHHHHRYRVVLIRLELDSGIYGLAMLLTSFTTVRDATGFSAPRMSNNQNVR